MGVREHAPGRSVLQGQLRHAEAVLRVRRPAGQRQLVRSERRAQRQRRAQLRLVPRRRRRRLLHRPGSERLVDRLFGIAGRCDEPSRPEGRTDDEHPAARPAGRRPRRRAVPRRGEHRSGTARAVRVRARERQRQRRAHAGAEHVLPLLLEHAVRAVAVQPVGDLPRRRSSVQVERSRHDVDGVARSDEDDRTQRPPDHGHCRRQADGVEARRRGLVQQHRHARRIARLVRRRVGGDQRRQPAGQPRRREDVEERRRQSAGRAEGDACVARDAVRIRRGHVLRHVRRAPHRRHEAVSVRHARFRRDVAVAGERIAGGRPERHLGRSGQSRPALPRVRVRVVRFARRGQELEAVHGGAADRADRRHRDSPA